MTHPEGHKIHLIRDRGLFHLEDPYELVGGCSRCGGSSGLVKCHMRDCWLATCEDCASWDKHLGLLKCWACMGSEEPDLVGMLRAGARFCVGCKDYQVDTHPQYRLCKGCVDMILVDKEKAKKWYSPGVVDTASGLMSPGPW